MIQTFDRRLSLIIVLLCLPLLFFPKINLITFAGRETAGVRIDDLLLMAFGMLFLGAQFLKNRYLRDIEFWMLALIGFSIASFLSNRLMVEEGILRPQAVLVYALRILEYFLFFYIGLEASRVISLDRLMRYFFAWNLTIMLMQKVGLVGFFTPQGYTPHGSWRCCGIGSFASEMGLLLNMLFCYFVYAPQATFSEKVVRLFPPSLRFFVRNSYVYVLFVVFAGLLLLNGSRIALVALVIAFLVKMRELISWRSPITWICACAFLVGIGLGISKIITMIDALATRSAGLLSLENLSLITRVWENINIDFDPIGKESVAYEGNVDLSWWIRIHKWCYALKIFFLHPEAWLQGIGPGFAMAGLDGGLLRIFVEYGLIGSYIFYRFFMCMYQLSRQMKWILIVFGLNMIFFDAYLAYKPMSFLFILAGYAYALKAQMPQYLPLSQLSRV